VHQKTQDKKNEILKFIKRKCIEDGIPPSVREICTAVNLKSTSSVHSYIEQLKQEGLLNKEGFKKRSAIPSDSERTVPVPILGRIAAGTPMLAEEDANEYVGIPTKIASKGEHFALTVVGDSMINAGILDGDLLIIRKSSYAANGQIVAALIEDEATVKRFFKENGHYRLQPENDDYEPIIVDEVKILGLIVACIRYY